MTIKEISFTSYDNYEMFGKLVMPGSTMQEERPQYPVVIYVQTAQGMTVDMEMPDGRGGTLAYFDIYREKLPEMGIAFFSYEGRGIRTGSELLRNLYAEINWDIYNTSTLDNKVRDIVSAVQVIRQQPEIDTSRIYLMGASEGTLLATEAARMPDEIAGLILYSVLPTTMRETFKYIMSDGLFLKYRGFFDTDADGKISQEEFEADPKKFRETLLKNAAFEEFDRDEDGIFTSDEMALVTKHYLDAVDTDDYEILDHWAKTMALVSTPENWFRDHFAHQPIWAFFAQLDMPIGVFHGMADPFTSVEGVKVLEQQAQKAGKPHMQFHYFEDQGHDLGIGMYLYAGGTLPEGHTAIFEYIRNQVEISTYHTIP
jgi:pimeloyl-ACP methyl ester carboxylesterase